MHQRQLGYRVQKAMFQQLFERYPSEVQLHLPGAWFYLCLNQGVGECLSGPYGQWATTWGCRRRDRRWFASEGQSLGWTMNIEIFQARSSHSRITCICLTVAPTSDLEQRTPKSTSLGIMAEIGLLSFTSKKNNFERSLPLWLFICQVWMKRERNKKLT